VPDTGHDNGTKGAASNGDWIAKPVLEGVRRRDPEALAKFFDVAFPYVYSLAFRLTRNQHAAEDVAQDVFLKIHRAADRLDVQRVPKPWITTITYNAFRDSVRRQATRREEIVNGTTMGDIPTKNGTPEDSLLRQERDQAVEQALSDLDESSRVVVILYTNCGHSHEDIAEIVGASHAAVRKRYSRALKQMAATLQGMLG
jgi:RNA polymerase sigma factor (sigma-70 family)